MYTLAIHLIHVSLNCLLNIALCLYEKKALKLWGNKLFMRIYHHLHHKKGRRKGNHEKMIQTGGEENRVGLMKCLNCGELTNRYTYMYHQQQQEGAIRGLELVYWYFCLLVVRKYYFVVQPIYTSGRLLLSLFRFIYSHNCRNHDSLDGIHRSVLPCVA